MQFLWLNSFLATQKTRSLHIIFIFFLPWILWIISLELVFCFVFDSFLNCVVFCSSSLATSERSSLLGCSLKVAFKSFAKLTGKYPHRSRPETLLRKRICNKYFPVFYKIFLDLFYGTFPGACSIVITRILNFF